MATVFTDEQAREPFRKEHDVRLVPSEMEGTGVNGQAGGTYGFTFAPMGAAPVFSQRKFQNYEIHKAVSGEKFLVGYVTAAEAEAIAKKTAADLSFYPDAYEQATQLVCVSLEDVSPRPQHSGQPGNPTALHFEP